jgi:hypothetical protein
MAKQAQIDAVRPVLNALDKEVSAAEKVIDAVVAGADKGTEVLEAGLETVADVVPEVLNKSVKVPASVTRRGVQALRDPRKVAIILGVSCAAAGAGLGVLGYKLLKKRLEKQFEERLERELEEMRIHYLARSKAGEFATPRSAAEALLAKEAIEALDQYQGNERPFPDPELEDRVTEELEKTTDGPTRYDKVKTAEHIVEDLKDKVVEVEVEEIVHRNVFVEGKPLVDDEWDAEAEERSRNPEVPYIISIEEYMENTFEHEQTQLTYYQGDGVLADEKDGMITEVEMIVGNENLSRFGHGSQDPNTVYVRNERTEADYEVTLSTGKFSEEVMGLRHSDDTSHLRRHKNRGRGDRE